MHSSNNSQATPGGMVAGSSRPFLNLVPIVFLIAVWPFHGSKIVMSSAQSVPAARGVIHLSRDANKNTKLEMAVHYLAEPAALTPPQGAYVVWVQQSGESPQNKGELKIGKDRSGNLTIITPLKRFEIYVTAEQSAQLTAPVGERVLSASVSE